MAARGASRIDEGRAFFRRLSAEGAWAPVFLLTGEEHFLLDTAVQRLSEAVFPGGTDDFNRSVHRAAETQAADVVAAARMAPMFADRRLVIAREVHLWNAGDLARVADYVAEPCVSTVLVLEGQVLDRRTRAVQAIEKATSVEVVRFPKLYENEVVTWVARRARGRGMLLARDVPGWLVEALGTQLGELDRALERIELYLGATDGEGEVRQVSLETAREVITDTRARSIFELTDALSDRDIGRATTVIDDMLVRQESAIGMVNMIARQLRQLRLLQVGVSRGLQGPALASAAGCPPFRVRQLLSAARGFGSRELEEALQACTRADAALKSSRLPDRLHLEALVLGICRGRLQSAPGG